MQKRKKRPSEEGALSFRTRRGKRTNPVTVNCSHKAHYVFILYQWLMRHFGSGCRYRALYLLHAPFELGMWISSRRGNYGSRVANTVTRSGAALFHGRSGSAPCARENQPQFRRSAFMGRAAQFRDSSTNSRTNRVSVLSCNSNEREH